MTFWILSFYITALIEKVTWICGAIFFFFFRTHKDVRDGLLAYLKETKKEGGELTLTSKPAQLALDAM